MVSATEYTITGIDPAGNVTFPHVHTTDGCYHLVDGRLPSFFHNKSDFQIKVPEAQRDLAFSMVIDLGYSIRVKAIAPGASPPSMIAMHKLTITRK